MAVVTYAWLNRTPVAAKASRHGVFTKVFPAIPRASARWLSPTIKITLGRVGRSFATPSATHTIIQRNNKQLFIPVILSRSIPRVLFNLINQHLFSRNRRQQMKRLNILFLCLQHLQRPIGAQQVKPALIFEA